MTDDEIIEMAEQAGAERGFSWMKFHTQESLVKFAALVAAKAAAKEREMCAKVVENYCGAWDDGGYALAQAIRARGAE